MQNVVILQRCLEAFEVVTTNLTKIDTLEQ
jgi:hypothetical protein